MGSIVRCTRLEQEQGMGTAASFLSPAPPAAETGPRARPVVVLLHSGLSRAIAGPAALQYLRAELPSPAKQEYGGCTKGCTRRCAGGMHVEVHTEMHKRMHSPEAAAAKGWG